MWQISKQHTSKQVYNVKIKYKPPRTLLNIEDTEQSKNQQNNTSHFLLQEQTVVSV